MSTRSPIHMYGQVDASVAAEIDRVAEQMVMPRSWVVAQILQEWVERQRMEVAGQSWEGAIRPGALDPV